MLDATAVLPTGSSRATCRTVQYEITDSDIRKYSSMLPMMDQTPNSSSVSCLVTIMMKIIPVTTLAEMPRTRLDPNKLRVCRP